MLIIFNQPTLQCRNTFRHRHEVAERSKRNHNSRLLPLRDETTARICQHDSWSTIPGDEVSSHIYRTAIDLWSKPKYPITANADFAGATFISNGQLRSDSQKSRCKQYSTDFEDDGIKIRVHQIQRNTDYDQSRDRRNVTRFAKYAISVQSCMGQRELHPEISKRGQVETEGSDGLQQLEASNDDEMICGTNGYLVNKNNKMCYKDVVGSNTVTNRDNDIENYKYDDSQNETALSGPNSDEKCTMRIPETGRKVEHITQKLEQTAQRYAREYSPPKVADKRKEEYPTTLDHKTMPLNDQRYQREIRIIQSRSETDETLQKDQIPYTDVMTVAIHPDQKRNTQKSSNRRLERPEPPFEDAPEPPHDRPIRGRRYSEKEEIYSNTTRFTRCRGTLEKDRGYESNFETKLEREKVVEKVQIPNRRKDSGVYITQSRELITPKTPEKDDINNSLKNKNGIQGRSKTTFGNTSHSRNTFDGEIKSPKLVKRTKSFWRFRRDSDVLEGMALWQHRSLVDIPKVIGEESKAEGVKDRKDLSRKSSQDNFVCSQSIGKDSRSSDNTITNDYHVHYQEEPKPAERSLLSDKPDDFNDSPIPAERPKAMERSECKNQNRAERPYFIGNISRKAILENERKRSMEAKKNMVMAELKENNEAKRSESRNKSYSDDDDGLIQNFSESEASDEESTYSCIIENDQPIAETTLLPRTKLRRDSERERDKTTCGPWYDHWGIDASVNSNKKNE